MTGILNVATSDRKKPQHNVARVWRGICGVICFSVATCVLSSSLYASDQNGDPEGKGKIVYRLPARVFVPSGFDDNDNVEVVLEGILSNTCFKVAPVSFTVKKESKRIYIENRIYAFGNCQERLVYLPYMQIVNLGSLEAGTYEVWIKGVEQDYHKMVDLPVAKAKKPEIDDETYAPVDGMSVHYNHGSPELELQGSLGNSCIRKQQVKVNYTPGRVIEVLPVVELAPTAGTANSGCETTSKRLSITVPLSRSLQGRYLIHVRSALGRSVNQVFEFEIMDEP